MKKVRILAIISAAVTALLLFVFLSSLSRPVDDDTMTVFVAATDIPSDTQITAGMIKTAELSPEAVVSGAITSQSEIVGKVSNTEIFAGEQILGAKLISTGESGSKTLAYAVKPGLRAISISVDETAGLAYMIAPGDRVDIIGQFLVPGSDETADNSAKVSHTVMILENINVLAVDNVLSKDGKISADSPVYTTLTLEVTPKQAMELSEAQFEGQLRAILRSPVDTDETK
ncbi:MAG: Flp pilus assembly protein CpaB, partial [Oscillospiraceae bacterium]